MCDHIWSRMFISSPLRERNHMWQRLEGASKGTAGNFLSLQHSLLLCFQKYSLQPFCVSLDSCSYLLLRPFKVVSIYKVCFSSLRSWEYTHSQFMFTSTENILRVCNQPTVSTHTYHTQTLFSNKGLCHGNGFKSITVLHDY